MKSYGWLKVALLMGVILGWNLTAKAAVDSDGDEYQLRLIGQGNIVSADPANIILAGTSLASSFSLTVTHVAGDGLVNVANLTTNGADLGIVSIDGDLGSLQIGRCYALEADSIGAQNPANSLLVEGWLRRLKVPNGIFNAELTVEGDVNVCQIGSADNTGSFVSNSTIAIQGSVLLQLKLEQSLTNNSTLTIGGYATSIDIVKSIADSTLQVTGSCPLLMVRGGITDGSTVNISESANTVLLGRTVRDSQVNVGNILKTCRIGALAGATLKAGTIDKLTIGDNVTDSSINVTGNLSLMQVNAINGLTLRAGGSLGRLQVFHGVADSLISAYTAIGLVHIIRDLENSSLIAGLDIGPDMIRDATDLKKGNCLIEKVTVLGEMVDSNIVAGIDAVGPDFRYGDGNDIPNDGDFGLSRIRNVHVLGDIRSNCLSGTSFTISAADSVDTILSRGRPFTGAAGVSVNEL